MSTAMSQSTQSLQDFEEGEDMSITTTLEALSHKSNRFEEVGQQEGEYLDIVEEFESQGIRVKQIFRVKNPRALKKFELEFLMQQDYLPKGQELDMRYLYHGSRAPLLQVCSDGLDRRLGKAGHFGQGIYFSDNPRKCVLFIQERGQRSMDPYVLRCRVILGNMKKYEPLQMDMSLVRGPLKEIKDGDHIYYDSVMGTPNRDGYREFVVYDGRQVSIEHVVLYDSSLGKAKSQAQGPVASVSRSMNKHMDETRQSIESQFVEAASLQATAAATDHTDSTQPGPSSTGPMDSISLKSLPPDLKDWQRQTPAVPRLQSPEPSTSSQAGASHGGAAAETETVVSNKQHDSAAYKQQASDTDPNKCSSKEESSSGLYQWTRVHGGGEIPARTLPSPPPPQTDQVTEDRAEEAEVEEEERSSPSPPLADTSEDEEEEETEDNKEFYQQFVRIQKSLPPPGTQTSDATDTESDVNRHDVRGPLSLLTRKQHFYQNRSPSKHREDWMDLIDTIANGNEDVREQLRTSFDQTYTNLEEYNKRAAEYQSKQAAADSAATDTGDTGSGNTAASVSDDDEDSIHEQVIKNVMKDFMQITEVTDHAKARHYVVTANTDLQAAVTLFYDQPMSS